MTKTKHTDINKRIKKGEVFPVRFLCDLRERTEIDDLDGEWTDDLIRDAHRHSMNYYRSPVGWRIRQLIEHERGNDEALRHRLHDNMVRHTNHIIKWTMQDALLEIERAYQNKWYWDRH